MRYQPSAGVGAARKSGCALGGSLGAPSWKQTYRSAEAEEAARLPHPDGPYLGGGRQAIGPNGGHDVGFSRNFGVENWLVLSRLAQRTLAPLRLKPRVAELVGGTNFRDYATRFTSNQRVFCRLKRVSRTKDQRLAADALPTRATIVPCLRPSSALATRLQP